jgi:long-chain acyl-CoA synthetase
VQNDGDLSSVTGLTYGGSAISETLLRQVIELFPNASITQAYGQTELSPCATMLLPEQHLRGLEGKPWLRSAGQPMIGMEIRIIDPDMNALERGRVGEVSVRGPGTMLGYWNQPALTEATLVDGWVRTGDAGYMDEDGFLYIVDRVKDMIISGGENVYSAEVENALSAHPGIQECAVIGVPDDKWGERVHAIVRARPDHSLDAEGVIAHCKALIATYKCPRSVDIREEALPMSPQGKILKAELRKAFWGDRQRGVA